MQVLSSPNVERWYVLISFSFKKLLSPLATVTGIVHKTLKEIRIFGNKSDVFDCNRCSNTDLWENASFGKRVFSVPTQRMDPFYGHHFDLSIFECVMQTHAMFYQSVMIRLIRNPRVSIWASSCSKRDCIEVIAVSIEQ